MSKLVLSKDLSLNLSLCLIAAVVFLFNSNLIEMRRSRDNVPILNGDRHMYSQDYSGGSSNAIVKEKCKWCLYFVNGLNTLVETADLLPLNKNTVIAKLPFQLKMACDHIYTELGGSETPAYSVCQRIFFHLLQMNDTIDDDATSVKIHFDDAVCEQTFNFCV